MQIFISSDKFPSTAEVKAWFRLALVAMELKSKSQERYDLMEIKTMEVETKDLLSPFITNF